MLDKKLNQVILEIIHEKDVSILDNNTILLSLIRDYYPGNNKEIYLQEKLTELISLGKLFNVFSNDMKSYDLLCAKLEKEMIDRFSITKEASESVLALWTDVFTSYLQKNENSVNNELQEKSEPMKCIECDKLKNIIKDREEFINDLKKIYQKHKRIVTYTDGVFVVVDLLLFLIFLLWIVNMGSFHSIFPFFCIVFFLLNFAYFIIRNT